MVGLKTCFGFVSSLQLAVAQHISIASAQTSRVNCCEVALSKSATELSRSIGWLIWRQLQGADGDEV